MNVTEIIVLILGILVFILSFLIPAGKKSKPEPHSGIKEEEIKELIDKEVADAKSRIQDIVDETITYSMEKTERSMERLTNEKIMAVNEYSDTVLEQINKNHKEVVFLYDMLNDKHENLKETVSEATKTVSEVKKTVKEAEAIPVQAVYAAAPAEEDIIKSTMTMVSASEDAAKAEQILAEEKVSEEVFSSLADSAEAVTAEGKPKRKSTRKAKTTVTPADTASGEAKAEKLDEADKTQKAEKAEKAGKVDISSIASPGKGGRNSNERILELHKAGKSNMAIAKELGLGIGEVKLVIDLFEGI